MKPQAYAGTTFMQRDTQYPTISGSAPTEIGEENSIVRILVGGEYYEAPIDPATGKYSWTATNPLPEGEYSVSITSVDRAGNVGKPLLFTLQVDITPPVAPTLLNLFDDQGLKTGSFNAGQTTDDKRPKLTGVAQPGTTVYLRDENDNNIGSAQADKITGKWVMEPSADLKDGVNTLTLVAEETFAKKIREGTPSTPFTIVIGEDTPILPPNTVTIREAIDDAGTVIGKLTNGALTDDTTPTLKGDVSAGNSVTVYYRLAGSNVWLDSAPATVSGTSWSWTPSAALPYGEYEFQASIGTNSSSLFTLDIATAADIVRKTQIESVYDDFGNWQGPLSNGAITDDSTPTFTGRGEANGKVVLRFAQPGLLPNSVVVDVDSSGHWMWTPVSDLPRGNWSFDVQQQGQTAWSEAFLLNIAGPGGFTPIITEGFDDVGVTGPLHSGDTTDDTTPTLYGRAEANSTVYLRAINGSSAPVYSIKADATGNWQWTPASALVFGNWDFQVSKTPTGGWGSAFKLVLELPAPPMIPVIEKFEDNVGADTGSDKGYEKSNDDTPTLHGRGKPGSIITIEYGLKTQDIGSNPRGTVSNWQHAGTAVVGVDGKWQLTSPSLGNTLGIYDYRAKASEGSNQTSWSTPSDFHYWRLTNSSGGAKTNNTSVTKGIAFKYTFLSPTEIFKITTYQQFNATIKMYDSNNKLLDEVYFSASGQQEKAIKSFIKIAYFTLTTDTSIIIQNIKWGTSVVSSRSAANVQNVLDNAAEVETAIISETTYKVDSVDSLAQQSVNGNIELTDTLQLTGKDQLLDLTQHNDALESIEVFDITGSGNNTLKLDINSVLLRGGKDLFIADGKTQLLVNGNDGDVVQLTDLLPTGADHSEWVQQSGTMVIAGVEYQVFSNGDAEVLVQLDVKVELPAASHTDNDEAASLASAINIDGISTQAYTGTLYVQRDTSLPVLSATSEKGEPGSFALIFVGGQEYEIPIDPATGKYSWTATVPLDDGIYSVSMAVRDRAGNVGNPLLFNLHIDTHPPEAPDLINLYDDQGAIRDSFDPGETTDDKRPQLTGLAQKGTTVFLRDENGNNIGSGIADKDTGIWVIEPVVDLKDGVNSLTLVATEIFDKKTRVGKVSEPFTIVIGPDAAALPPNSMTIKETVDNAGNVNGKLTSGALTDDTTPTLHGDADFASHVNSYILNTQNSNNEPLKVALEDILQHGKKEMFITSGSKQTLIKGDEGDVVQLKDILPQNSDISEWKHQKGTVTVAGVEYQVYSHNDAELLVQQGVKTELI